MSLSSSIYGAAFQAIEQHQRILVIPHANVDPDGLSSALACFHMLKMMGKDVTVICPYTPPDSLKFLPNYEKLSRQIEEGRDFVVTINLETGVEVDKLRYTVEDQKVNIIVVPKKGVIHSSQVSFGEGEGNYDLIIAVDTADLNLFGKIYTDHVDLFANTPILNIDHHISNTRYGQIHMIDPTCASATEVLYSWFLQTPAFKDHITADVATLLLTGLITDTRSFQNPNTTPRSLEVAAELLEKGARQQEIIQHVYKTKPLSTLKIWGRALNRIQIDAANHIVWSAISKDDLAEMEAKSSETHGILDELISTIPDADVHVLFTETEDGTIKASMRSSAAIDASKLAGQTYGGGGHARAAGFKVKGYDNFQLQVIESVKKLQEGMKAQRDEVDNGERTTERGQSINGQRTEDNEQKASSQAAEKTDAGQPPKPLPVRQAGITQNPEPQKQKSIDIVKETVGSGPAVGQDVVQSIAKGPAFQ